MKWHDSDSHKVYDSEDFDFCNWVIRRVTWRRFADINMASKSPAFWKAIRTNPKNLVVKRDNHKFQRTGYRVLP
jgi:hypothetical protein